MNLSHQKISFCQISHVFMSLRPADDSIVSLDECVTDQMSLQYSLLWAWWILIELRNAFGESVVVAHRLTPDDDLGPK